MRFFSVVLLLHCVPAFCAPTLRAQSPTIVPCSQSSPYVMTDGGISEEVAKEPIPEKQIEILDHYVSQHKLKTSMPHYLYLLYLRSYSDLRDFPRVMEYSNKVLTFDGSANAGERYFALHQWASAYVNLNSDDTGLAAKALERAHEGIELVRTMDAPQCGDPKTFAAEKKLATIYFRALAASAAMKSKDYDAVSNLLREIIEGAAGIRPPSGKSTEN